MIELTNVTKTFHTAAGDVEALKGVSLKVDKGDIFGVVGFSGAGKSTLIRCVNLLERPDSGTIVVNGNELTAFSEKQLEQARQGIGMIFQHFNLLNSMTVFDNIAFPLRYGRKSRQEIKKRVDELLSLVDLTEKADVYPSQLSGGQKQRVAIARALATNPQILLSDEATSALDPQTTASIFQLLKKLNRQLGLTIMLITHEMDVVKEICNNVAVMEDGVIVEQQDTFSLFTNPQTDIAKRFANSIFDNRDLEKLLRDENCVQKLTGTHIYHLFYSSDSSMDSHITNAARKFCVDISIVCGSIEVLHGRPIGSLYIAVKGNAEATAAAINYFETVGIHVSSVETAKEG